MVPAEAVARRLHPAEELGASHTLTGSLPVLPEPLAGQVPPGMRVPQAILGLHLLACV